MTTASTATASEPARWHLPQHSLAERFGRTVRRLRQARGWSQEALAGRAELNRTYMGEIERATTMPSLQTAAKLAQALEVPLAELIGRCEG